MNLSQLGFQRLIAFVGVGLFFGKLIAWKITNSDAIFSDAMEGIVNVISAFMGLYSLYLAAQPMDENHPYGHGKIEFVTSAIEGVLILLAGGMIIFQAINSYFEGIVIKNIDSGIWIVLLTAILNYVLGYWSIKRGEKVNSLVLLSSGKHLQSDTYTTFGVVISLSLVYFTKLFWLDSVIALIFGCYIIYVGYTIIRKSISGIMDEADPKLLDKIAEVLQKNRIPSWIDVHNMKIVQYGSQLHIDAHLTLPWYFNLKDAHADMEKAIKSIVNEVDRDIEFNFHMDDCKAFSCEICQMDCSHRQGEYKSTVTWNKEVLAKNLKHQCKTNIQ